MIPQVIGVVAVSIFIFLLSVVLGKNWNKWFGIESERKSKEQRNERLRKKFAERERMSELDDEYKRLKNKVKCKTCGADVFQPEAKFCPMCGEEL